jgi:hypothetical protein
MQSLHAKGAGAILLIARVLSLTAGILAGAAVNAGPPEAAQAHAPATRPSDPRLWPYDANPQHLWNRLHRALFARAIPGGSGLRVHRADPLLFRGGKFLLDGEPHRLAIATLDEFLAGDAGAMSVKDPLKRLFLGHDLWAAFDYVAWYPDDWVFRRQFEPAAIALRRRLARAIERLALDDREIGALPDNYAVAVRSKQYPTDHDPQRPQQPFLPPDLFDPNGPWVRFHEAAAGPMAREHFHRGREDAQRTSSSFACPVGAPPPSGTCMI